MEIVEEGRVGYGGVGARGDHVDGLVGGGICEDLFGDWERYCGVGEVVALVVIVRKEYAWIELVEMIVGNCT